MVHYLRFFIRKQPIFTALNFAGLTIGITSALLLFHYIYTEKNYDLQSPHAKHIWRVFNQTADGQGVITKDANTHSAIGPTLKAEVPGVVDYARLYCSTSPEVVVIANGKPFEVNRCYMTDQGFLRMFPQEVLYGNSATCLDAPHQALITQTQSLRLFGTVDALGSSFSVTAGMMAGQYTVSAIIADPPQQTHLKFDLLLSNATRYANGHQDNFDSYWDYNYFQLTPNTDPETVRHKLAEISEKHLKKEGITLDIQRFSDIHLYSNLTYELEPNGSARSVNFLGIIAFLLLGIAFINYVNLSTALANERRKEVGIKKAIGASRGMLIGQFVVENLLLSGAAFAVSLFCYLQCLPWFVQLNDRPLIPIQSYGYWVMVTGTVLLIALVAGLYPALQLSGFKPIASLRGEMSRVSGQWLRKTLVTTQFVCSIALIFGVLVIGKQLNFLKKHELGVNLDQLITLKSVPMQGSDTLSSRKLALFKTRCEAIPGVLGQSASSVVPGIGVNSLSGSNRPIHWTQKPDYARITTYFAETDASFFELLGIRVLAGQHRYHADRATRYRTVSINRALLKALGFPSPEAAIGQEIAFENSENGATMTIGAVVEDFHIESLKTAPKPTIYYCFAPEELNYISLRLRPENLQSTLSQLQANWIEIFPDRPFRYWFLDEKFAQQYRSETQFGKVFGVFAGLAVFISCLGLLGLTAFNLQRRRKEIGIRKVLGASIGALTGLLAKDLLKLMVLSMLIASPIGYYFMQQWLTDFAYRIDIQGWMFVAAGLIAAIIAMLTVGFQSIRAALTNPVESLRSE